MHRLVQELPKTFGHPAEHFEAMQKGVALKTATGWLLAGLGPGIHDRQHRRPGCLCRDSVAPPVKFSSFNLALLLSFDFVLV